MKLPVRCLRLSVHANIREILPTSRGIAMISAEATELNRGLPPIYLMANWRMATFFDEYLG